jgi:hypothetical protein
MSQLFTAVYDIHSALAGHPTLRLSLVVDGRNDTIIGNARIDGEPGIAVRGHHVEIGGERPVQAILLAGTPAIFGGDDEQPSAFQLLMVLPTAWKAGQVCYKMSFGQHRARVLEIRDGVAHAVLPEQLH